MNDPEATCAIRCDVELDIKGPTTKVINGWLADALRKLADQIERDEFEDGHHDVKDRHGRRFGGVYFDFYEIHEL